MLLITGGAGFIGSCLIKKLNDEGFYDILVADRLGFGDKWKNLVGKRITGIEHKDDFLDLLESGKYTGEIEAIFHLGACTVTTEKDADYLVENNLNYSIRLAKYACENDIRFIYASSAATYGDGSLGYDDNKIFGFMPLNQYGFSKQLFDQWVEENHLSGTFTGLKFFNVFGPNEYHKGDMASMVYKSYHQVIKNGKVRLFKSDKPDYGNGEQKRDFIYVKDVVNVIYHIFKDDQIKGIFNLGTGNAVSWNELIGEVFNSLGKKQNIEYIDLPDSLKGQYQYFTQAEMKKLQLQLPDLKFYSTKESVKDYIQGYLVKPWQNL